MDSIVLFQQLLVLLALMLTGAIAYKTKLIDDGTYDHLSSLMVWILNPFLMISGVVGKECNISRKIIIENVIMVGMLYVALFVIGFIFCFAMRFKEQKNYLYRLVTLFPNVGFMGVPLVKEIFGSEYIVFVAFYMLAFNIICYSYGIYLSSRYGGNTEPFQLKKILSPGTVTALGSIMIFAFHLQLPTPVITYVNYLGNTSISFSMIIIGVFMARLDWKTAFKNKEYFLFALVDMIVIPIVYILGIRLLPFDPIVLGVAKVMICMPVASMTCMFTQEYAKDGTECAKIIALTTICTVVTAPLVIYITK